MTSTRILKPSGDRRGASRETMSRRIMKKPLIGSRTATPATRRKNHAPRSLSFWRAGERPPGAVSSATRVPMARLPRPAASASYIFGRINSSCCKSPSITATKSALDDSQPSTTAPARPTRLTRRMQRSARIARRQGIGDVGGAVGRIVVDDDHFPGQAGERRLQPLEKHGNVGRFAVGRHDHGEGRPRLWRRRIRMSFRAQKGARGDSRAATSVRIRHGKGARQARRGSTARSGASVTARPAPSRLRRRE